jgi:hypothetical protein
MEPDWVPIFFIDEGGQYSSLMKAAITCLELCTSYKLEMPKMTFQDLTIHTLDGFSCGSIGNIWLQDSLNPSSDIHSTQMLYLYPRILMGILAVALVIFHFVAACEYQCSNNNISF